MRARVRVPVWVQSVALFSSSVLRHAPRRRGARPSSLLLGGRGGRWPRLRLRSGRGRRQPGEFGGPQLVTVSDFGWMVHREGGNPGVGFGCFCSRDSVMSLNTLSSGSICSGEGVHASWRCSQAVARQLGIHEYLRVLQWASTKLPVCFVGVLVASALRWRHRERRMLVAAVILCGGAEGLDGARVSARGAVNRKTSRLARFPG